jgi:hypothetical protein
VSEWGSNKWGKRVLDGIFCGPRKVALGVMDRWGRVINPEFSCGFVDRLSRRLNSSLF